MTLKELYDLAMKMRDLAVAGEYLQAIAIFFQIVQEFMKLAATKKTMSDEDKDYGTKIKALFGETVLACPQATAEEVKAAKIGDGTFLKLLLELFAKWAPILLPIFI